MIGVTPERFAAVANRVLAPKILPKLSTEHLHMAMVSVAVESRNVIALLRRNKSMTFRAMVLDAESTLVVVARFLSLLELYKDGQIRFEQVIALGELQITWVGRQEGEILVSDEFDRQPTLSEDGSIGDIGEGSKQ
jgi:segregation and condensation protein A